MKKIVLHAKGIWVGMFDREICCQPYLPFKATIADSIDSVTCKSCLKIIECDFGKKNLFKYQKYRELNGHNIINKSTE